MLQALCRRYPIMLQQDMSTPALLSPDFRHIPTRNTRLWIGSSKLRILHGFLLHRPYEVLR
jgi:hypothetical protein